MSISAKSYLEVQYDLRPAKQVERRMLIDAFQLLTSAGFKIHNYQYTGFGSIHFVDFILFHKFLGIKKMVSIEYDYDIKKRVQFNRPYKMVNIEMAAAEEVIVRLAKDTKHILWLDYDEKINEDMLTDIALSATTLSKGSVVLVTMDANPPGKESDDDYGPKMWKDYYFSVAESYLGDYSNTEDFVESNLTEINTQIFSNVMRNSISSRKGLEFFPFLNFSYADGHRMVTCGGMICSSTQKEMIKKCSLKEREYTRFDFIKPSFEIRVPKITRKERLYLESNMPCLKSWRPEKFEFSKDDILAYRDIYRYFPAYAEMML